MDFENMIGKDLEKIKALGDAANLLKELMLNSDQVSDEEKLPLRIIEAYEKINKNASAIMNHFSKEVGLMEELGAKKNTLDYLNLVALGLEQYMRDIGIRGDQQ